MDKNAIKKYAVWARRELISRVSQKALQYGITDKDIVLATATSVNGVVLSNDEIKQRKALIEQINKKGYEQVMEEVAYTWFNRFSALRFMEVNGYLPSHVRVFTDEDNNFKPQILAEAINLELDGLDMEKVYALKDANDDDALFKYLVIVQCNALSTILPGMFQRIADYTELLFPDNLLRDGSAIQQMIELIPEDDWKDAVQIIGWLYQYYNSEKKDEVFAALKKNVKIIKENIPAATQLFTPDWIVRYMVENSLGRLWVEGHPNDELQSEWKYYLDEAEQEPEVQAQLAEIRKEYATITPEQIKCIDPCSGSGHICAYMFDVLVQIYEAYGYTAREAVRSIVENNLYGLDIDERAAQLAYFAVMMKARQYDRRFLTRKDENGNPDVPQPHIYAIVESNGIDSYALDYFVSDDPKLKAAMDSIIKEMRDAKEYGSVLNITSVDFKALYARFAEVRDDINMSRETVLNDILPLVNVARVMAQKYDSVITNPPYLTASGMSANLAKYVKNHYADSKADMFAVFMEQNMKMLAPNRFMAMITMQGWMFLSSFESIRNKMINNNITSLIQIGYNSFPELNSKVTQAVSFVVRKMSADKYCGTYLDLTTNYGQSADKEEAFFDTIRKKNEYICNSSRFRVIPGHPLVYTASEQLLQDFQEKSLGEIAKPRQGLATGDNGRFTKIWFEVPVNNIYFSAHNRAEAEKTGKKWFPYNKGGEYRKWYGNNDWVVDWSNDGFEIRNFRDEKGKLYSRPQNMEAYFQPSITWSKVSTSGIAFRFKDWGHIFDVAGTSVFAEPTLLSYLLAFCNSAVAGTIAQMISPTVNYEVGHVSSFPIIESEQHKERCCELAKENIAISKADWDSFEISWDFCFHPFIRKVKTIEEAYKQWEQESDARFYTLKSNEEELNRIFIEIYGLQNDLTSPVEEKLVSVRRADLGRDIRSFISYAVGCMFGRYSLDVPGLVYAGGEWDASKFTTFSADKDSIIPICDDEYFDDDIVGRFIKFVEVVYGSNTLDDNLKFISSALGGNGNPKEVIRSYFFNDFFNDHCAVYQVVGSGKRPIYWQFDSGKKNGFKCLIYMHRYQPDTIARIRTDYVHEQQSRYRTAIADLEQRISSSSTSDRVKLNKKLKTLQEQATEIQCYEEKIHHLADQYISIDLDDGVKKNYAIFGDVLAQIK